MFFQCAPERDALRTLNQEFVEADSTTPHVIGLPLSKRKLRSLFKLIEKSVDTLPELEQEDSLFDDS